MKKGFTLFSTSIIILLFTASLKGQTTPPIDITNYGDTSTNPISVCQCDTIGTSLDVTSMFGAVRSEPLKYFLDDPYNPTSTFDYQFTVLGPGLIPDFSSPTSLSLFKLTPAAPNETMPVDTHTAGVKWAHLIIPCSTPPGPAAVRIVNSLGDVSDTAYINVNRMPAKPVINEIIGGNVYSYEPDPDPTAWAFCPGDSIMLVAQVQAGANITWLRSGSEFLDDLGFPHTNDTVWVKEPATYALRMDFGFCARDSKDTVINLNIPPSDITLQTPSAAFQIDKTLPNDSIGFCQDMSFVLVGPDSADNFGVEFTYQWLTDTTPVTVPPTPVQYWPADTSAFVVGAPRTDDSIAFVVDSSLFSFINGVARLYLEVTDSNGCKDTSDAYYIYMDSIPSTPITHNIYTNGLIGPTLSAPAVCFRDSVLLRATYSAANVDYLWESTIDSSSSGSWTSSPADTLQTLLVDSLNNGLLRYYRVRTFTKSSTTGVILCEDISDIITARWFERDSIIYQADPWVHNVGFDSISFCAADSAILIAPTIPPQLQGQLFYSYQWMRDMLDTATMTIVQVPIAGETQPTMAVNESGTYYVQIDDGICTEIIRNFHVFVDSVPATNIVPVPFPNGAPSDLNLCLTDSTLLTATDTVLPGYNYQWEYLTDTAVGWVSLPGDTMPWITADTSYNTGMDTVLFRLFMNYENDFGLTICDGYSDTLQVVFYNPPVINIFPSDSVGICPGDSILLIAQGNSFGYVWSPTGQVTADVWLKTAGTYTVTGTGINGCQTTHEVIVYDIQTSASAGPDVTVVSGEEATLSASGGTSYQWSASNPLNWSDFLSQSTVVSYTLPDGVKSDTITVYVKVFNTLGCTDMDSLLLIVVSPEGPGTALIDQAWNLFTPNNDGRNDTWDITAITNGKGCRIDILNRWGSVVFSAESFNGIWDGTDNGGTELPDGTYYYILSCDGEILLKNAVTIIRNK